jgi:hypothetical protein
MTPTKHCLLILSFLMSTAAMPIQAEDAELPEITVDGLHLVPDSKLAIVYADPDADLTPYGRVQLLDAYVAFRKNWERDQRRTSAASFPVRPKDMEEMKATMAQEFRDIFTQVLEDGGYPVVDEAAEDVLLVRPAIINLDPTAPDSPNPGRSTTYVASAGEMTLYIEVYDSVSGDILAKALDRKADRRNDGFYTWSSSVTNKAAAERILRGWATILLNALNEAKQ